MVFLIAHPYALVATFAWVGFVGSISFMESWVKFQAPNVNLSVGLGIGRLVFRALNYVEWFFALSIAISLVFTDSFPVTITLIPYLVAFLLVIIQSVWMLRALDKRAQQVIDGDNPGKSKLHYYYVSAELLKIACLIYFGIALMQF